MPYQAWGLCHTLSCGDNGRRVAPVEVAIIVPGAPKGRAYFLSAISSAHHFDVEVRRAHRAPQP
jgi:hypothetical protein